MMYKFLLSLLFLVSLTFIATAQTDASVNEGPPSSPEEYEARYQERIKLSEIAGVYIPIDLDDAFQQLERLQREKSHQEVMDYLNTEEIRIKEVKTAMESSIAKGQDLLQQLTTPTKE